MLSISIDIDPSERVFICGKTGSGKTFMAKHLLETMRGAGWRIAIIDPKHFWDEGRKDWSKKKQVARLTDPYWWRRLTHVFPSSASNPVHPVGKTPG